MDQKKELKDQEKPEDLDVSQLEDGELEDVSGGVNSSGCQGDCFCKLE